MGSNNDREWNIEMIIRQRPRDKFQKAEARYGDKQGANDFEVEKVLDSILNQPDQ